MRFRVKDLLPFIGLLLAAFLILWIYFYFTNQGNVERIQYPIDRSFKETSIRLGKKILTEYYRDAYPELYVIRGAFYLKLGVKDGFAHWLKIDSVDRHTEIKLSTTTGEILQDVIDSCFYFSKLGHLIIRNATTLESDVINISDSVLVFTILNNKHFLFLEQGFSDSAVQLYFSRKSLYEQSSKHILELPKDSYTSYAERRMAYDGLFTHVGNYITYSCLYMPYVYVFTSQGDYVQTIQTRDKVPNPQLLHYKNNILFEPGKTFNTNYISWIYKKRVFVFSHRIEFSETDFIVDIYDLQSGLYCESFRITSNGLGNNRSVYGFFYYSGQYYLECEDGLVELLLDL